MNKIKIISEYTKYKKGQIVEASKEESIDLLAHGRAIRILELKQEKKPEKVKSSVKKISPKKAKKANKNV
ncbi:MAG: hypothetical protein ACJAZX_000392 [Rickettsiales bacterium]|jgi:hypothetical protein